MKDSIESLLQDEKEETKLKTETDIKIEEMSSILIAEAETLETIEATKMIDLRLGMTDTEEDLIHEEAQDQDQEEAKDLMAGTTVLNPEDLSQLQIVLLRL